jgi:peptide/nickel transport system substrate-binding protein
MIMKKLRWQLVIILITGLVVGILLLNQQRQQQEQLQSTSTVQGTTPVPVSGGIYTEGLIGTLKRLNPLLAVNNSVDRDICRLVFSSLVTFDSLGNPQPDLAESWGMSQDGTLYNFSLRKDLVWHDGNPITADDVIFTVELMRTAGGILPADLVSFWKDVEVKGLSEQQLQFRLPESFAPFLNYLTFGVLPKHLLEGVTPAKLAEDSFNLHPVGSGPYQFDHFLMDQNQIIGVVLKAFDRYYVHKPYIDQFVLRYYPDAKTALEAYQAGEVQGISQVDTDTLPAALAQPGLSLYTSRQPRLMLVYLNLKNDDVAFFQDAAFRRALLAGINRQSIMDQVFAGQAVMADGPILPGNWAYYDHIDHLSYDLSGALNMLKDAGYELAKDSSDLINTKDSKSVAFQLLYPDLPAYQSVAEALKKDWASLGITVDLEAKPYAELISQRLEQHVYQAALVQISLSNSPDPDPYPFWDQAMTESGQNYSQWDNRTASEFLEQARVTVDQGERIRLYHNFQVTFSKEMPSLPLFYPMYTYAIDSQVQGVQIGPLFDASDRFADAVNWSLPIAKTTAKTAVPAASATTAPSQ